MNEKLERDLDEVHEAFFGQFDVDRATGIVRGPYVKFPAYPYVGSRYGKLKKLLFVGLDIGADETCGSIQSYEDRRARIEGDSEHPDRLGPHMSGTYVTAMRLLAGENDEWKRWLEGADRERTAQALLDDTSRHPSLNPLSYIAFTNYYKFLLVQSGEKLQLEWKYEENFLVEEAGALAPDIIVLQSAVFREGHDCLIRQLSHVAEKVFVSDHPSVRGEKRRLGNYLEAIQLFESASDRG